MSEADFSKHTLQASFKGGMKAIPKTLPSAGVAKQVVQLTPGALGITDSADPGPGLKAIPVG